MSSSDGNTVESLQAQLAERDAKIEMLKSKTAAFVEKLKSGHAEALLQEQTARQQLQDKLEAAKPIFLRFKDEKATLTDQLNTRTQELESAEQSFKSQMLDMQKKIDESSTMQLQRQAAGTSAVNNQLDAVRLEAEAAIEAGKRDSEMTVKNLTAQLNAKEELLTKQAKEHLESNAVTAAALAQLKESNAALTKSSDDMMKKLVSREAELLAAQKRLSDQKISQENLAAELAAALAASTLEATKRSAVEAELVASASQLVKSRAELTAVQEQAAAAQQKSVTSDKKEEADKAAAHKSAENIEQLKRDLQLSEERLQEAEEAAWKAKAESSELMYALEQEQGSTKKLSLKVEGLESEISKQAAEHAAAVSLSNTNGDEKQQLVESESEKKSKDVPAVHNSLPLPPNADAKANTESKQHGSTVEPLSTAADDSKVEKKVEVESDAEVKSNGAQGGDEKSPQIGSAVAKEEKKKEEEEKEEAGSVQKALLSSQTEVTRLSERCRQLEAELFKAKSEAEHSNALDSAALKKREKELTGQVEVLKSQAADTHHLTLESAAVTGEADKEVLSLRAALLEEKNKTEKEKESHALQLKEAKAAQEAALSSLTAAHEAALQEREETHALAISGATEYVTSLEASLAAEREKACADGVSGRDSANAVEALSKQLSEAQTKITSGEGEKVQAEKALEDRISHLQAELKVLQHQIISDTRTHKEAAAAVQEKHTAEFTVLVKSHSSAIAAREDASKGELKERSDSKDLLSSQHKKTVSALTDECSGLKETVRTLNARCSELEKESVAIASDSAALKKREKELTGQVEVLKSQAADTHRLALESAAVTGEVDKEVLSLRAALLEEKNKTEKEKESHLLAIASLKQKEVESEGVAAELIAEQTKLTSQLKEAKGQVEETQARSIKAESSLEEVKAALRESQEKAQSLTAALSTVEKSLRDANDSATKRSAASSSDVQKLEASLASKKFDLDASKANLAATTTAYSALSAQHNQLKAKADQLAQQLEAENQQTQERKQKVREYVDKLNAEKREMEEVKEGMAVQLATAVSKISSLEGHVSSLEQRVQKEEQRTAASFHKAQVDLEQQQQDHISALEAKDNLFSVQVQETARLQALLDEHATATAEEVQEAYRRMALSGKELESHKAKRLVARNEMIGAAQALERSQSEGQALRAHIQYKLAPIVFEQVAALEMLLGAVEHFRSQLSSKSNVRLHNTASEYLSRRLIQSGTPQVQGPSPSSSPEGSLSMTMSSIHSNNTLTLRTHTTKAGDESDSKGVFLSDRDRDGDRDGAASRPIEAGYTRDSSPMGSRGIPPFRGQSQGQGQGQGLGNVSILGEAMEQAEVLRRELNRVHAGLSLLSHSVDRLGDTVAVDSRCCGGVFQMLSDSMTGSIEGTIRGSIVGRTLVSHNNNSSSGRARPIAGGGSGIGGMISSGLGYSTVSGDEGPRSFRQGPRRSTSPSRDLQSNSGSGAQKEGGKKAISAIDSAFSILPHDEDEDGEELEII